MLADDPLFAGIPALPVGSRVARQHLENGVDILAMEVPSSRKVRLVAAVGVGYLDEPREWPGLAHLLEHSLFLGSHDSPQPGAFAAWVGEQGGRYNAKTAEHVTDYHLSLPAGVALEGVSRLVDLLVRPCLRADAMRREIGVIDAEFQARLADPALHHQAALSRLFDLGHPAAHFHAGHRGTLGKGSSALCQALGDFHATHYRAERISVVMLGPASLASQLKLLKAVCRNIPGGAQPLQRRSAARWGPPGYLQWCLPAHLITRAPRLEMLWPLSDVLTEHHAALLDHALTVLGDGQLAATLRYQDAITAMAVTVRPEGAGPALRLTLTLTRTGLRCIDQLLATCRSAVSELPARLAARQYAWPPAGETDLDDCSLQLARRLAQSSFTHRRGAGFQQALDELGTCLLPSACRVMEEKETLGGNADQVANTLTPFRLIKGRCDGVVDGSPKLPPHSAPQIALQPVSTQDANGGSPTTTDFLASNEGFDLWWAGGGGQRDSCWCLGWPSLCPSSGPARQHRLEVWQQRTLALRQAALNSGVMLTLGGDTRGDWLMVRGNPHGLESVAAQALSEWRATPPVALQQGVLQQGFSPSGGAPTGLLAQRMLVCLELPRLGRAARPWDQRLLSWSAGWLGPTEYQRAAQRLAAQAAKLLDPHRDVAETSHEALPENVSRVPRWLAVQGEDHALMLQLDGPDDSPMSRLLMRLLADAHDAAFFQELRLRQGLGYVAAVRYREAEGWPRLGYVVQSPHANIEVLQEAVERFLVEQGVALACLEEATLARRRDSLRSLWGPPETSDEAALASWHALRIHATTEPNGFSPKRTHLTLKPWEAMEKALTGVTCEALQVFATVLMAESSKQWWYHSPQSD